MATKVTGAEFKRFYNDLKYWPEGGSTYHEDVAFTINGDEISDDQDPGEVAATDIVGIDGGIVIHSPLYSPGKEPSLAAYYKRWLREQNTVFLAVQCDRAALESVTAAIKAAGGKVVA